MTALIAVFVAAFGLCVGSFLNVCICRLPTGESILFGRSHCTSCGRTLRERDMVPVLSYLLLRGRCRFCGSRIRLQYPAVELLNALIWLALFFRFGLTLLFVCGALFASALTVAAFIDAQTQTIPNGVVAFIALLGAVLCVFGRDLPFYDRLFGALAAGAPLFAAVLLSRGGMGLGDGLLAAAAGLFLGWRLGLLSLFFAILGAAVFGLCLVLIGHKPFKTAIPFGPFLAVSFFVSLLAGDRILSLYLSLFVHAAR